MPPFSRCHHPLVAQLWCCGSLNAYRTPSRVSGELVELSESSVCCRSCCCGRHARPWRADACLYAAHGCRMMACAGSGARGVLDKVAVLSCDCTRLVSCICSTIQCPNADSVRFWIDSHNMQLRCKKIALQLTMNYCGSLRTAGRSGNARSASGPVIGKILVKTRDPAPTQADLRRTHPQPASCRYPGSRPMIRLYASRLPDPFYFPPLRPPSHPSNSVFPSEMCGRRVGRVGVWCGPRWLARASPGAALLPRPCGRRRRLASAALAL